jgi:hypothetical protein
MFLILVSYFHIEIHFVDENNKDLLETIYPKLQDKVDLIRMIINVYRQIQQEAFGIVLINKQNKVRRNLYSKSSHVLLGIFGAK